MTLICAICLELNVAYPLNALLGSDRCPLHYTWKRCTAINARRRDICGRSCSSDRCDKHAKCDVFNEPCSHSERCEFFIKKSNRTCSNKKTGNSAFCKVHSKSARTEPPPKQAESDSQFNPITFKTLNRMSFTEISDYFYNLKRKILQLSTAASTKLVDTILLQKSLDVKCILDYIDLIPPTSQDFDKFHKLRKLVHALHTTSGVYYINKNK